MFFFFFKYSMQSRRLEKNENKHNIIFTPVAAGGGREGGMNEGCVSTCLPTYTMTAIRSRRRRSRAACETQSSRIESIYYEGRRRGRLGTGAAAEKDFRTVVRFAENLERVDLKASPPPPPCHLVRLTV